MSDANTYDVAIIGGGPAGMTSAIYAARAGLKTIILEENVTGGLVNSTYTVENFPSYPTIHGMKLMENMREHVDSLSVKVEEICEIESVDFESSAKKIVTDEDTYIAKSIIVATGRKPIPLDTPTQAEQIHHCAICDGGPYKGKKVLVVGGGNSAFDESLYMLGIGIEHITLIEKMDRFFAAKNTQDQLLNSGKVTAYTETEVVDLIVENDILKSAVLKNISTNEEFTIDIDGIFVFLGQTPNTAVFESSITLSERGYILANENMETNVSGVFSAGDINDKRFRQITTAMSDGTIAALSAENYLRTLKN